MRRRYNRYKGNTHQGRKNYFMIRVIFSFILSAVIFYLIASATLNVLVAMFVSIIAFCFLLKLTNFERLEMVRERNRFIDNEERRAAAWGQGPRAMRTNEYDEINTDGILHNTAKWNHVWGNR